jgi:HEAT repeat protein
MEMALDHSHPDTRFAAAVVLGLLGESSSLERLAAGLESPASWQRFAAIVALGKLRTPEATALIQQHTNDPDPQLRQFVEQVRTSGIIPALIQLLQTEPQPEEDQGLFDTRYWAARALLFFQDASAATALRGLAEDRSEEARSAARLALRRIERLTGGQTAPAD